MANEVLSAEN